MKIPYKITFWFCLTSAVIVSGIFIYLDNTLPDTAGHMAAGPLIVSLVISIVLAAAAGFLVSAPISKALTEITVAARAVAAGNISKNARVVTDDEAGELAKAFNSMSEGVGQKIRDIALGRSRLEAVLLSMSEGVMAIDASGRILFINQALKNFLAVRDEAVGKRPIEVIRNIEIQDITDRALKAERLGEFREISVLLDEEKTLSVHASPVVREGKTEGAVIVLHDVTGLRRLERVRRDFVANVSHELRTPVASIKGYAETLLGGALEDKRNAMDFIEIIHSNAGQLAKLIEDLLDLSSVESDKLKMILRPCGIGPIVERVVSGLTRQAAERSVTIRANIPEHIPDIFADEARITQVLFNLVENAVKYNRDGGSIVISAAGKDGLVRIDVSDTGSGIPEKDLERVFERFYRVDKARSRELGGTGLGLSIVKHIVQAHNGEVSVRSMPGEGSTFSFTVPAV